MARMEACQSLKVLAQLREHLVAQQVLIDVVEGKDRVAVQIVAVVTDADLADDSRTWC
jgi:hypothetical protein